MYLHDISLEQVKGNLNKYLNRQAFEEHLPVNHPGKLRIRSFDTISFLANR